jgi:hypothetical protein
MSVFVWSVVAFWPEKKIMGRPYRKLPISREVGRSLELSLTAESWDKIQAAYGYPLSNTVRQAIVEATNNYLASEVFERNAKPSKPVIDMVEAIKAASDNLRKKLSPAGGESGAFAQSVIRQYLSSKHLQVEPYEQVFQVLGEVMSSLSAACIQALSELDDPDAKVFRDGVSWASWIRALTAIAEQNVLPTAAHKAGDSEAEFGPFARFVEALQVHLPKQARRHANTRLSSEIYHARQQAFDLIQESK